MGKIKFVVVLLMVVALLSCIPTAMAMHATCTETVNPHGINVPPAGWSTAPGTNPNSGINDDGFFLLTAWGYSPRVEYINITVIDKGTDNLVDENTHPDGTGTADDDKIFGPYKVMTVTDGPYPYTAYLKIKYTEANGAEPSEKVMGSNNAKGNGKDKGQADAVAYHIKGQGDPAWFFEYYRVGGTPFQTTVLLSDTCYVSPPPR